MSHVLASLTTALADRYRVEPELDQRFIMSKDALMTPIPTVVLVENWFPELLAKVNP